MTDIFLSYSREDHSTAKLLAAALEQQGWCVFWDRTSILPGQDINEVIEQAIDNAKCLVVIWSKAASNSDWVKGEADIGRERKILAQIHIEAIKPPIQFRSFHNEDFSQWQGDIDSQAFKKLCQAVSRFVGEKPAEITTIMPVIPQAQQSNKLMSAPTRQPFEPEMVIIPAG